MDRLQGCRKRANQRTVATAASILFAVFVKPCLPLAGEWIHVAALAIKAEIPLATLRDTIVQFPTFSEAYVSALRALPS
jgi:pyruvate/2-oxoglutarate dehydrogenase complex dihydrolipoamide dehydrogenase (E3) component